MCVASDVTPLSSTTLKLSPRRNSSTDAAAQLVNGLLQLARPQPAAVKEERAAAVRAKLDESHRLAAGRHVAEAFGVDFEVRAGHADGALVAEYQSFERARAVAPDFWKLLLGDREDAPALLFGKAKIEDAELGAGRVLLNDRVAGGVRQVLFQRRARTHDGDARTALPAVGLQHDGEGQRVPAHEGESRLDARRRASRGRQQPRARDEVS